MPALHKTTVDSFRIKKHESQRMAAVQLTSRTWCDAPRDPSLRLKNGFAQDDAEAIIATNLRRATIQITDLGL
jgi:hypothetical protein